ncbi:magnesium citrate secondary transporter [Pontibacter ruber]|uniref:Magnesium citrate secondary transporter n=1 Tax=Pontibacter ruber TaxID=1343895 RepID=A0ABW5CZF4_9BACT|nr:magnesium citrate secondary transporter [Pontibacter ruber]
MATLRHPAFILAVALFCINQALELANVYIRPLHTYLDDLLCMPVILTLALAAERAYFRNNRFVFPFHYIAGAVLGYSICFELLLPQLSPKYTADLLDVVAYTLGAVLFRYTINKPLKQAGSAPV